MLSIHCFRQPRVKKDEDKLFYSLLKVVCFFKYEAKKNFSEGEIFITNRLYHKFNHVWLFSRSLDYFLFAFLLQRLRMKVRKSRNNDEKKTERKERRRENFIPSPMLFVIFISFAIRVLSLWHDACRTCLIIFINMMLRCRPFLSSSSLVHLLVD